MNFRIGYCCWVPLASVLPALLSACGSESSSCASVENRVSNCYIGAAFATCPGAGPSMAYCGPTGGCLWVSNGCPLPDYQAHLPADCNCRGDFCWGVEASATMASFVGTRGDVPWDRLREMNLSVKIDTTLKPGQPAIHCASCSGGCSTEATPCGAKELTIRRYMPGTYFVRFHSKTAFAGWDLEIEADFAAKPHTARACRFPFTDAPQCKSGQPICATSGSLVLAARPTKSDFLKVKGAFKFTFADGVVIDGTL
jgi:hypothetical protein